MPGKDPRPMRPASMIRELLGAARAEVKAQENVVEKIGAEVSEIVKRLEEEKSRLRSAGFKVAWLESDLRLAKGIPRDIIAMRRQISRLAGESKRDDITVARQNELSRQLAEAKEALKKSCPHGYVLYDAGVSDRDCDGDERGHRGKFGCVVCGKSAATEDHGVNCPTFPVEGDRSFLSRHHDLLEHGIPYAETRKISFEKRFNWYLDIEDPKKLIKEFAVGVKMRHRPYNTL